MRWLRSIGDVPIRTNGVHQRGHLPGQRHLAGRVVTEGDVAPEWDDNGSGWARGAAQHRWRTVTLVRQGWRRRQRGCCAEQRRTRGYRAGAKHAAGARVTGGRSPA